MEKLINEFSVGLFVWQSIIFLALLFLLRKYAWKPILKAVNEREANIADSIEQAEKTKEEMKALQAKNEDLLKEARAERDNILKEAKEAANTMIEDAKSKSKVEAQKIVEAARLNINSEKAAAIAEIKTHVATLAVEIAEKVVRGELASDEKQKALAEKLAGDIQMN